MRFLAHRLLILVVIFLTACQSRPADVVLPDEFEADVYVGAWVEFWNTYDLDRVDDLFLDDARLTYFSSEIEEIIRGLENVREHHVGFEFVPGGRAPEQELWVEDVQSSAFETSAVVTARWFFGDHTAPRDSVSQGPMTAVYVLHGNSYKIAHMHFANY